MHLFIKRLIIFGFLFLISISIVSLFWISINYPDVDLPAPNLSNSYSFNEKMLFMNGKNESKNLDVLAIGSSLALNNLHSLSVVKNFGTENFINASSWGLDIKSNFQLLKILHEVYTPEKLIMVVNLVDFQSKDISIKYKYLKEFLQTNHISAFHIRTFNLEYYFKNISYSNRVRNCKNDYDYLGFDAYGGVNLQSKNFNIDPIRWKGDSDLGELDFEQYLYMDSIASFCASNSIKLYVFQSPIRIGYYLNLDETEKKKISSHQNTIQKMSDKYNLIITSSSDSSWEDSLFVDELHLNESGAKFFTELCFKKIERQ
jgi:hypothetical protein